MRLISWLSITAIMLILSSCKKDKPEQDVVSATLSNGMLVLCEGLFQQNNSTVSWVNLANSTVANNLFENRVGRQLGDTGNDIQRYGNKIYIVVNASSTIEVLDATTFQSIQQIDMVNGSVAKQPRSIVFNGSNAYVSCYDGFVDVIDTSTLLVTQRIQVGANPEGMAIANNKLYVANSGGLNFPNVDSTLSVIDLSTSTELAKIAIGKNPSSVITDLQGEIYVINRGDYAAVPSSISRIDTQNDVVISTLAINATHITSMNSNFIIANYDYNTSASNVLLFDPLNETVINPNFISTAGITTLYGVQYDSFRNKIYIMDAMSFTNTGYINLFNSTGSPIEKFHVGLNPNKIIFYD
ncbi:MAG TPA: YncE family protein [Crocinitomicaceae bacterium]|nr:YncE family protein [Crocinitomicaceae bacterium]